MPIEITMPALSPTMEKGNLARWLVKAGDAVRSGDLLAEIETDKASMELEAAEDGVITQIIVTEGTDGVAVGAVIALLDRDGAALAAPISQPPMASTPVIAALGSAEIRSNEPTPAHPREGGDERNSATAPSTTPVPANGEVKASPLARRIASANAIDLRTILGTGPRGKIVKADLPLAERVSVRPALLALLDAPAAPAQPPPIDTPYELVKLSGMRKTIARRLTEAKQTVPHFYLSVDVRLDELLKLRASLNASLAEQGVKISVNDFLIKALAIALERTPDAHVQYGGDQLYRFSRVDVSMAVAVPGGQVTPVIRDAASKRLSRIAAESSDFASRARAGKLLPEDYQGGTVSISNLGMFGMKQIIPVINPPQALIVGVGAAEERVLAIGGEVRVATVMTVSASFDHRAIDGATGAAFLHTLKLLLEHPIELLA